MAGQGPRRRLASPAVARKLLTASDIHPRRSMGQNFLVDANILDIIAEAASLAPGDTVIEVGAGLGALTELLVERCRKVFALESDPRLAGVLRSELGDADNLVLLEVDAVGFDLSGLWPDEPPVGVKMVANLPYGIAAMLVVDCLSRFPWITEYTVMLQREVADRVISTPGNRIYSAVTVKIACRASVSKVATISRNSFYPRPGVDSTLLRLERLGADEVPGGPLGAGEEEFLDRLVTAAFHQRRKKLANSLSSRLPTIDREDVYRALASIGREENVRAEALSPEEFVRLAGLLAPPAV
ncbi:MAG: ribosomal RNA small subunit methyltransferase A [Actinobacteria bacterium]|nr:ribosomal RNA small subunit methyltransferase A [Actinomycetota bacterium]